MTKNITSFKGFTPDTFKFLRDISENNYKEWFEANKHIYQTEVVLYLKELATALSPTMHNIDPQINLNLNKVVSRIYRDTRFSKNKDPYKDRMWLFFEQATDDCGSTPSFYFEISANQYRIDMGMYAPKKKVMDDFRDKIAYDATEFKAETQKLLDLGLEICGEEYKRPLKNELPDYFQQWVQRKSLFVSVQKPITDDLYDSNFVKTLEKHFQDMIWLYNFMKN